MTELKSIETYVNGHQAKHKWDKSTLSDTDAIIEIACEVADQMLHEQFPETQHWIESETVHDCLSYTEESQDIFDKYYDEVTAYIGSKVSADTGKEE